MELANNESPTCEFIIGSNTYIVGIHFNQSSKETMESKIKHLIRKDMNEKTCLY